MSFRIFISITVFGILMSSCSDEKEECAFIPSSSQPIDLEFESLSDSLVDISKPALVKFLDRHRVIRDQFFRRDLYPSDSAFLNELHRRFNDPNIDTLLMEVKRVFGNENSLKLEFTEALENLTYYYPNARIPKIKTVISGLENDMVVSDTLIIIGLDYFLGRGAKYRPAMYEYLLRQYNRENIVPSCMMLFGIDEKFNKTNPDDKTVLADMIAYGKSFYFAKQMVPCTPDSVFIWYTEKEMKGARKNQDLIWARFVEDKLLYATTHKLKQKYLGDRPKTVEVGPECPGRIAQWVGWEIVKSYMKEHPDTTLPQMMEMENADKIFKESKYKPERR